MCVLDNFSKPKEEKVDWVKKMNDIIEEKKKNGLVGIHISVMSTNKKGDIKLTTMTKTFKKENNETKN